MALALRSFVAVSLLGVLACSSGGEDAAADVAPFSGSLGNQPVPSAPATDNPSPDGSQTSPGSQPPGNEPPGNEPPGNGSPGGASEGMPPVTMVAPPPSMMPGGTGAGGAPAGGGAGGNTAMQGPAGSGGAPAAGGAPSTLPPEPVLSGLPVPPGPGGVARPSGPAQNLRVLNWAGFRAAISYTFDDTNGSQIQRYQELNALGVPLTFYLITAANHTQDLQSPVWRQAVEDGHELGNHTANHLNAGSAGLAADTDAGEATLERMFGITVYTMAAPFGAADYINIARTRYLINRGTPGGTIAANGNSDPFNLPTFTPMAMAPVGAFNSGVDGIRNAGTWQTVLLHGFTNSVNDGAFQPVAIGVFQQAVNYAKSFGDVWIDTVVAVGSYWRAQTAFSSATRTTNGDATTFAWTLPDHFPPGKFLRVTVDGGTLTQAGVPIAWDDHGYYEIALDQGSVTLSP